MLRREFAAYIISSIWLTQPTLTVDERFILEETIGLHRKNLTIEINRYFDQQIEEPVTNPKFSIDGVYLFHLCVNSYVSKEFFEQYFPFSRIE